MKSAQKEILVILGNYGSGKTEVSINLAANQKLLGVDVCIVDLDLVNLYFRTREAQDSLTKMGIRVVVPEKKYLNADLPILSSEVGRVIRLADRLTILDVGGDSAGATVLASLAEHLKGKRIRALQVVNRFRPFTENIEGCIKIKQQIEKASKMSITGIIGNSNLIDETTVEDIYKGYEFVLSYSAKTDLKLEFITVPETLFSEIDESRFLCPILPIQRQLLPPWKKSKKTIFSVV